jgi:hypothetical protein
MTPLEGALAALDAGWSVFPVKAGLKEPANENGCNGAAREVDRSWTGNWGIAGGPSGLVIVDVDVAKGGTVDHVNALPATLTIRTGSGGWHLYYSGQSANRIGLVPGVDIRSVGGYVVAPGGYTVPEVRTDKSGVVHGNGHYVVERALPVAPAPQWLLDLIGAKAVAAKPTSRHQGPAPSAAEVRAVVAAFALAGPPRSGGHDVLFCATEILARGAWPDESIIDVVRQISEVIRADGREGVRVATDHLSNREAGQGGRYGKPRLGEIYGAAAGALVAALEPCPLGSTPNANQPTQLAAIPGAPAISSASTQINGADGSRLAEWTLLNGSLMGAPQTVERALKAYRTAHVRREPGTEPELTNSSAVIKWLAGVKGWSPDRIAAELGRDAGEFALSLQAPEVQTVGRLTRIDRLLAAHELRWNEMALSIEIDGETWTDNHTAIVRLALEQTGACDPEKPIPNGDIEQRARALAVPYHPVQEYLLALPPWDGVERVNGLWTRYFGAEDCELNRKLSACFALGAVRRVLEPGTKVDMMPILFGDQGEYKSSGLSELVGGAPFFTDAAPGFGHRSENAMTLAGCWVWEIAEMQGMDRADQNAVKAFVTRREDDVLLPYARTKSRLRRRSVCIGTTNDETCLNDPTGSRRHPVIAIRTIDREALRTDRDVFWAEALQRVRAGEPHWLEKADERAMGERNLQHTRSDDVVLAALQAWFDLPADQRFRSTYERRFPPREAPLVSPTFTMRDAVTYAFDGKADPSLQSRIGIALRAMGVECRRSGKSKIRTYTFPS